MRRFILICLALLICGSSFGANSELSKQATAFYSDNNPTRTMDLILQINEKERSAQDWLLLGNVLADKGEVENALYMYEKAIAKDKKCYKAYYNIGNYYMDKGQFQLALDNYKKAASIKTDNAYIQYNIGCAYLKLEEYKLARLYFYRAILQKSDVAEFHYNLAYAYKKLGNEKMAETYIENYSKLTGN